MKEMDDLWRKIGFMRENGGFTIFSQGSLFKIFSIGGAVAPRPLRGCVNFKGISCENHPSSYDLMSRYLVVILAGGDTWLYSAIYWGLSSSDCRFPFTKSIFKWRSTGAFGHLMTILPAQLCILTYWLVVWNIFCFSIIYGIILPIDFYIFQRG